MTVLSEAFLYSHISITSDANVYPTKNCYHKPSNWIILNILGFVLLALAYWAESTANTILLFLNSKNAFLFELA